MRSDRTAYQMSTALAVVAAIAAGATYLFPWLIHGTEVTQGNLRGTALVVLAAALPLLGTTLVLGPGVSARWCVVRLGATFYLLYQAVLFCFATPFNNLFLFYVAFLGLAVWTAIEQVREADVPAFGEHVDARMPFRTIAGVTLAFALLNGLAWLSRVLPTVVADDPASVLDGSGLTTSPVWVQDLAFWVPAAVLAAAWMWQRRPDGVLLTGAILTFYVAECVSIASDQWFGARADPAHPELASTSLVVPFLVAAMVVALPLAAYLRNIDRPQDLTSPVDAEEVHAQEDHHEPGPRVEGWPTYS